MAPIVPHPAASLSSSSFSSSDSESDSNSVVQIINQVPSSTAVHNVNNPIVVLSSSASFSSSSSSKGAPPPPPPPPAKTPRKQSWLFCDEAKILSAMAAHRAATGRLPTPSVLLDALLKEGVHLRRRRLTAVDLGKKVSSLKKRFQDAVDSKAARRRRRPSRRDVALFDLSKKVWPELNPTLISSSSSASTA